MGWRCPSPLAKSLLDRTLGMLASAVNSAPRDLVGRDVGNQRG